jgi:hypothetical protein
MYKKKANKNAINKLFTFTFLQLLLEMTFKFTNTQLNSKYKRKS